MHLSFLESAAILQKEDQKKLKEKRYLHKTPYTHNSLPMLH